MTTNQIALEKLKEVDFIRLVFTDINGKLKNVELSKSQLDRVLEGEVMFDGSSIDGFSRIEESDMYLVPDLNTVQVMPWKLEDEKRVALIFCNSHTTDKKPYEGDPRNVLIRTLEKAKKLGFEVMVGPEPEFFLLKPDGTPNDQGGYFDLSPIDTAVNTRRDIVLALEELGFTVEAAHHEVALGQHEVDFKYDEALKTADNIQMFKYVVKNVSKKHGLNATFMAKPIQGINGSGMHCNISLFKDGENVFAGEGEHLSDTARHFIAGVLNHAREMAAITNPTVNSYKRIVPGYEAPVYVAWSGSNRSCMVRIPASGGKATRVEVRNPDPMANPYLALAVLIEAGLRGVEEKAVAPKEEKTNLFALTLDQVNEMGVETLPSNLKEAVEELKGSKLVKDVLGNHLFNTFIKEKEEEWDEFRLSISEWERKRYQ
ncbi:glutamine synthetase family protein [Priestia megaterium]|uniref:glutamine synthetase family protein n=1 Tax=Priestia megaterium TaxID=1404 RepID=UPI002E1EA22A|nr:glutamine synthetase family protein [Priestia megaterium]